MDQETGKNIKWIYRIALITSLLSILWLIYYYLAHSEAPFSWYAVPTMLVIVLPLLACTVIGLKWPLVAGILLIIVGFLWPANAFSFGLSGLTTWMIIRAQLPISLPFLISGILFIFLRQSYIGSRVKIKLSPRMQLMGILMIFIAGVFSFGRELTTRLNMPGSFISTILTALLISIGIFLLAIASWAQPRYGGIIGTVYSALMLVFFFTTQAEDRTVIQMLSDLRYDFIILVLIFLGSIMILLSPSWKPNSKPAK